MATTVAQHSVATFTSPVNGTTPIDANTVRGNDNTIRSSYNDHDADAGIHVQSSTLASRPAAGTAGRKWITTDAGNQKLWYDDGTDWHEVGGDAINLYCKATETLVKGDVVKITGYNTGQSVPEIAKVASASDVAFGICETAIANGSLGYVINTGTLSDVATNSFSLGDILYPNTSGGLTATKPTSGTYQPVAYVLRSNLNNGVLYVEFSAPRIVEASANTASTIVRRDASGNFSAGTITAGALTATGLVTFASLKGTGATTVTDILNDSTMATASATTLATSASIKTYVDTKVATVDTLAEILANGNTTGANDIIVSAGQKLRTPAIAAQDGSASISIANTTGALTLTTALADSNLATISTAGKVANSATTATSANTASAIVARDGSGNFSAGTITATTLGGTLSTAAQPNITSVGTLTSLTVGSNLFAVDTSGFLTAGAAWSSHPSRTTQPQMWIYKNSGISGLMCVGDGQVSLVQLLRAQTSSAAATFLFVKTRGTYAAPAAVASGDQIGLTRYDVYGGTNNRNIAATAAHVETYTSDTDISSYLTFSTSAAGGTTATERWRINGAGHLLAGADASYDIGASGATRPRNYYGSGTLTVGGAATADSVQSVKCVSVGNATPSTSGAGITFPATQSASSDANTLDDYEEGTWTPAWAFSTSGSVTLVVNEANYTKVGRMVVARMRGYTTAISSPTGNATMTGLPFTASGTYPAGVVGEAVSWNTDMPNLLARANSTSIEFTKNATNAATSQVLGSDFITGGANNVISVTVTYFV